MTFFSSRDVEAGTVEVEAGTEIAVVTMAYEPDLFYVLDGETGVEDVEEFLRDGKSVAFTATVDDIK